MRAARRMGEKGEHRDQYTALDRRKETKQRVEPLLWTSDRGKEERERRERKARDENRWERQQISFIGPPSPPCPPSLLPSRWSDLHPFFPSLYFHARNLVKTKNHQPFLFDRRRDSSSLRSVSFPHSLSRLPSLQDK